MDQTPPRNSLCFWELSVSSYQFSVLSFQFPVSSFLFPEMSPVVRTCLGCLGLLLNEVWEFFAPAAGGAGTLRGAPFGTNRLRSRNYPSGGWRGRARSWHAMTG